MKFFIFSYHKNSKYCAPTLSELPSFTAGMMKDNNEFLVTVYFECTLFTVSCSSHKNPHYSNFRVTQQHLGWQQGYSQGEFNKGLLNRNCSKSVVSVFIVIKFALRQVLPESVKIFGRVQLLQI